MKNILLINQGKTENLGDKAINIVFQELLKEQKCTVDFAGFAQTNEQFIDEMKSETKRTIKSVLKSLTPTLLIWFFKYRKQIRKEFEPLKVNKYDLVIIGGGQLIKTKNVFVYTLFTWTSLIRKYLKCPIVLAGIGADNKYSNIEKRIYKKILPQIRDIYVRDKISQQVLMQEFNIISKYIPDIVFAYSRFEHPVDPSMKKNKLLVMVYDYKALKRNFGTQYETINLYFEFWKNLIEENIEEGLQVVLAYTTIGDKKTTYAFSDYLRDNSEVEFYIHKTDRLDDLVNLLQSTRTLISARMHGMLLGLNYSCKVVPFVISSKIQAFKNEWLDEEFNIEEVRQEINVSIIDLLRNINHME